MLRLILILALCCPLLSCKNFIEKYKRSNSGVSALDKKVLADFREPLPDHPPNLDPATEQKVFAAIPPASCPGSGANRAPLKMYVSAAASGSFTYAAEHETLYLVSGIACEPHNRLLVFSADKLESSADVPYDRLLQTPDLNDDGKNEMLLAGESRNNNEVNREATFVEFDRNSLRQVESFGIVYHDACALFIGADSAKQQQLVAAGRTPNIEAVVIYYLPRPRHERPSFTAERYRASCPASAGGKHGPWQLVAPK